MTVSCKKSDQPRKESSNQLPHSKLMAKVELQLPTTDGLRSFLTPVLFLIAAVGALAIDMPVAQFSKNVSCPRLVVELLDRAEPFGHFFGAVMALTAVVLLDPAMRGRIGWAIGATLGGGLLANLIKLLVLRSRPRASNLIDGTVWDTFGGWFQRDLNSRSQSFPSGHTATAVGLAVVLAAWYPRGRWLFATIAALVGLHRIQHLAHFPSDVFAGAAVGWFVAACCLRGDRDRFENRGHDIATVTHDIKATRDRADAG